MKQNRFLKEAHGPRHAMFFKPPKIDSNQHDTTTTTFSSPCRNHFKSFNFCVRGSTSKFSRLPTKSSQIVAYEFHQCGLFNLKTKENYLSLLMDK